jgi:hypothetical protein
MDQNEPDLDQPGIPLPDWNQRGDVIHEIPMTIRQNLADLLTVRGGPDQVTDEDLARIGRSRRDLT